MTGHMIGGHPTDQDKEQTVYDAAHCASAIQEEWCQEHGGWRYVPLLVARAACHRMLG